MPDLAAFPAVLIPLIGALIMGYLLGSIPFGVLLTQMGGAGDLRQIGSGNIGATNVLRTGRKGLAIATLLGDMLKGTFAVVIASSITQDAAISAGFGAFLGHLYPIWLNFKGGKGVATYLGILIGLSTPTAIAFALVWLSVAFITRYSSLAALMAAFTTPFVLWALNFMPIASLFVVLSLMLIFKHKENIARLLAGKEPRIGQKSDTDTPS